MNYTRHPRVNISTRINNNFKTKSYNAYLRGRKKNHILYAFAFNFTVAVIGEELAGSKQGAWRHPAPLPLKIKPLICEIKPVVRLFFGISAPRKMLVMAVCSDSIALSIEVLVAH